MAPIAPIAAHFAQSHALPNVPLIFSQIPSNFACNLEIFSSQVLR
jgi:hypothetical protein